MFNKTISGKNKLIKDAIASFNIFLSSDLELFKSSIKNEFGVVSISINRSVVVGRNDKKEITIFSIHSTNGKVSLIDVSIVTDKHGSTIELTSTRSDSRYLNSQPMMPFKLLLEKDKIKSMKGTNHERYNYTKTSQTQQL